MPDFRRYLPKPYYTQIYVLFDPDISGNIAIVYSDWQEENSSIFQLALMSQPYLVLAPF